MSANVHVNAILSTLASELGSVVQDDEDSDDEAKCPTTIGFQSVLAIHKVFQNLEVTVKVGNGSWYTRLHTTYCTVPYRNAITRSFVFSSDSPGGTASLLPTPPCTWKPAGSCSCTFSCSFRLVVVPWFPTCCVAGRAFCAGNGFQVRGGPP